MTNVTHFQRILVVTATHNEALVHTGPGCFIRFGLPANEGNFLVSHHLYLFSLWYYSYEVIRLGLAVSSSKIRWGWCFVSIAV